MLTIYDTDAGILAAIEAGATGYLLEDAPPGELVAAIRAAAAGRTTLVRVWPTSRAADQAPDDRLVAQELEVLRLLAAGRSDAEFSRELFLSRPP